MTPRGPGLHAAAWDARTGATKGTCDRDLLLQRSVNAG